MEMVPNSSMLVFYPDDSQLTNGRLVLDRLLKSRHHNARLAERMQQLLENWFAGSSATHDEETP